MRAWRHRSSDHQGSSLASGGRRGCLQLRYRGFYGSDGGTPLNVPVAGLDGRPSPRPTFTQWAGLRPSGFVVRLAQSILTRLHDLLRKLG